MTWWTALILIIIGLWTFFRVMRARLHKKAIDKRVTVAYADQNFHFETIFPAQGTIHRKILIDKTPFFIVTLDKSFSYESNSYTSIIIKERLAGQYIGSERKTEVHVLLPRLALDKDTYKFSDFDHVVWATIEPE